MTRCLDGRSDFAKFSSSLAEVRLSDTYTYCLIVTITNLLASELGHPALGIIATSRVDSRYHKRHVEGLNLYMCLSRP
jgi:hypothetical protein